MPQVQIKYKTLKILDYEIDQYFFFKYQNLFFEKFVTKQFENLKIIRKFIIFKVFK